MVGGRTYSKWFPDDSKDSFRAASAWESDRKRKAQSERNTAHREPEPEGLTLLQWQTAYLAYCESRITSGVHRDKKSFARRFFTFFSADVPVSELSISVVSEYMSRQSLTRTGNAVNADRKNLAAAWEWGQRHITGFPAIPNPFRMVAKMPEVRHPRHVPSESDFWQVYDVCKGQDRVMLLTALHLALRRNELFNLQWSDIDWSAGTVRIYTSKRSGGVREYDWLPLTEELQSVLRNWQSERPLKQVSYVFYKQPDPERIRTGVGMKFIKRNKFMYAACGRAGVKRFGFHAIRHLSATILFRSGYSVAVIQRILRHKTARTTEVYLHQMGLLDFKIDGAVFRRGDGTVNGGNGKPGQVIHLNRAA
jgi:integrase